MSVSWRERLRLEPQWRDFSTWPLIDHDEISPDLRHRYQRNRQIVALILDGTLSKEVAKRFNLSKGYISQLLNRCLGGDERKPPHLTKGLIPGLNLKKRQRDAELPTLTRTCGTSGAFEALLREVPSLREGLESMIEAKHRDSPYAQRIKPQDVHGHFKLLLSEANWPQDRYPYTSASCARESVRRFLHKYVQELDRAKQQHAQSQPQPFSIARYYRAQLCTQIDAHQINLESHIGLILNGELLPLRLARAHLLLCKNVDTHCNLGYHLAPTAHPTQQDVLTLFANCMLPWTPLALSTPGLSYTPGACFPSGRPDAFPISFGVIQLDNALEHLARSVLQLLCIRMGARMSLGLPGQPKTRHDIEAAFGLISNQVSNRPASTTGSHPKDPARESRANRRLPPSISFQTVNEALSVTLTDQNICPLPTLGNTAPLELFDAHCRDHFVRYVPPELYRQWHPLLDTQVVKLHWNRREERDPHINFYYARYQGPGLLKIAGLEQYIKVRFVRSDIRSLQAYALDGTDLGPVYVSRSWQRFPHSLATRIWIHKNARLFRYPRLDLLSGCLRYLLEHRDQPSMALNLVRIYFDFKGGENGPLQLDTSLDISDPNSSDSPHAGIDFVWDEAMANHRGKDHDIS